LVPGTVSSVISQSNFR